MNSDTLTDTLQKGFRLTLGATASLLEALQDPQGSSRKFSELSTDMDRLTEELEAKGAVTEQEARQFVDGMLTQVPNLFNQGSAAPQSRTVYTVATPVSDPSIQPELEALTQQLAEIRREIETLKQQNGQG
jgi:polyhydroxyalkanoate synthesis regulator phasin